MARVIMGSEGQTYRSQDLYDCFTILLQLQRILRVDNSFEVLQQPAVRLLAFKQVAFILLVAELSGRPPPHEPEGLHFVVHKRPIVCERPESADLAAVNIKVSTISRNLHVATSRFVQLLQDPTVGEVFL